MNAPSTDALEAARLVDRLERLARLDATPDPLNAAQWEALRYLARANRYSRTPAAVADYLASTRGTVSRTLAALEDKGYLQREDNPRDGRSVDFALTARGRKAAQRDPLLAMAADMDASLGAEVARLRRLLQRSLHGSIARNGGRPLKGLLLDRLDAQRRMWHTRLWRFANSFRSADLRKRKFANPQGLIRRSL